MKSLDRTLLGLGGLVLVAALLLFMRVNDSEVARPGVFRGAFLSEEVGVPGELLETSSAFDTAQLDTAPITPPSTRAVVEGALPSEVYAIEVRVVDGRGRAVRNSSVRLWKHEEERGRDPDFDLDVVNARTEDDATFSFELQVPGEYRVWAWAEDHISSEVAAVTLTVDEPGEEVELVLPDGLAIKGVVLDEDYGPVIGAGVHAYVDVERTGFELPRGVTSIEYYGKPAARSREDGEFWLYPVRPEAARYELVAGIRGEAVTAELFVGSRSRRRVFGNAAQPSEQVTRLSGVEGGAIGVRLVFSEEVHAGPGLRLALSTGGVGELPKQVGYWLRHVGPRGSVFSESRGQAILNEQNVALIPGLIVGARYELTLSTGGMCWVRKLDSFLASSGGTTLHVKVPGLFPATFELLDPSGRLAGDARLRVYTSEESWLACQVAQVSIGQAEQLICCLMPPGHISVQLYSQGQLLARYELEMPPSAETFRIDVP